MFRMFRMLIFIFTVVSFGCATFQMPELSEVEVESPTDAEFAALRTASRYPHPFALKLTVNQLPLDRRKSGEADSDFLAAVSTDEEKPVPMLMNPDNLPEIERYFMEALRKYETFTVVDTDLEGFDAELIINLEQDLANNLLMTRERYLGFGTLNIGLWLLAGVPGWFVADTAFSPAVRVTYSLNRKNRKPDTGPESFPLVSNNNPGVDVSNLELSFSERNQEWDYLLQILWPPTFLTPDLVKTDYNLGIKILERSAREIAVAVKRRVNDGHQQLSRTVPFLYQIRDDEGLHLFLLSNSSILASTWTRDGEPPKWADTRADAREFLERDEVLRRLSDSGRYDYLNSITLPSAPGSEGSVGAGTFKLTANLRAAQTVTWTWTLSSGGSDPSAPQLVSKS